jgi:cytochrome c biogenesis protein CcmG/thiol:disulfide interchange protein DsbE
VSRSKRPVARWAIIVAVAALLASGCDDGAVTNPQRGSGKTAAPPTAPKYAARKLGGKQVVDIADLQGKPLLLTSWATWCTECRTELPEIQKLADRYGPHGLQVVGVDVDEGGDQGPLAFADQHHLRFPMLHDEGHKYQVAFQEVGTPQTELISSDGKMIKVWQGAFDTTDPVNLKLIEAQLPKVASGGPST